MENHKVDNNIDDNVYGENVVNKWPIRFTSQLICVSGCELMLAQFAFNENGGKDTAEAEEKRST